MDSMTRVERASQALVFGNEILSLVKSAPAIKKLTAAADANLVPVGAISDDLHREFGKELANLPVRQFVGMAVRAVLEQQGYVVASKGVKLPSRDKIFRTGSTYRKVSNSASDPATMARAPIIRHFMDGLTQADWKVAFEHMKAKYGVPL